MTRDTVFDLASLTKPVATATSVMVLLERGKFRLGDRVVAHLPELKGQRQGRDHDRATAPAPLGPDPRRPDLRLRRGARGRLAEDRRAVAGGPARRAVHLQRRRVPDPRPAGREGLGAVARRVRPRRRSSTRWGWSTPASGPVGGPPDEPTPLARVAPTERDGDGQMLRGVVHDPRSRALGGRRRPRRAVRHGGRPGRLRPDAPRRRQGARRPAGALPADRPGDGRPRLDPRRPASGAGLGRRHLVQRPAGQPVRPDQLRPHRVHRHQPLGRPGDRDVRDPPDQPPPPRRQGRPAPDALRAEVATLVASAIVDAPARLADRPAAAAPAAAPRPPRSGRSIAGSTSWPAGGSASSQGKRVGLVTNHTGRTKAGVSTIDLLFAAPGVELVALFSPEHGIRGAVDTEVADAKDEKTGLPIFSLYGKTRKPTAESLAGVEVLVYDIQDIGARFYTYISTLGLVLEAARENHIPVVVLDRPNPIGGDGRGRARSATPTSPRSSPTTPCPSATG